MSDKHETNLARRFFLHTPADAIQSYVFWAEKLASDPGITYGCILDKHMIPLHPGDLMAVVARPGHGKSSWMAYMAAAEARNIVGREKQDSETVVYVSWEQPIEEVEAYFEAGDAYTVTDMAWGRVPLDTIKKRAIKRIHLPVHLIGQSTRHAHIPKPTMTVDIVYEAIEALYDEYQKEPTLVCLDYLQIVPAGYGERRDRVAEATYRAKQLAIQIGAPIVAGVQATRRVDEYSKPMPTMSDAQWSSAIEQTADKQISLWRPSKTHDMTENPFIEVGGTEYKNDEDLMVIKLLKQRFERGFGVWAVKFKPQTLEVHDYETRDILL